MCQQGVAAQARPLRPAHPSRSKLKISVGPSIQRVTERGKVDFLHKRNPVFDERWEWQACCEARWRGELWGPGSSPVRHGARVAGTLYNRARASHAQAVFCDRPVPFAPSRCAPAAWSWWLMAIRQLARGPSSRWVCSPGWPEQMRALDSTAKQRHSARVAAVGGAAVLHHQTLLHLFAAARR